MTLILIIAGAILFLIIIPAILWHSHALSKKYGPARHVDGPICAKGRLTCVAWKAPFIGKRPSFEYSFTLHKNGPDLSGTFQTKPRGRPKKPIYSGDFFLTHQDGQVKGRAGKVVFGALGGGQADLTLGNPAGSLLQFLNSSFQFRIHGEELFLLNTDNGQASINQNSRLAVTKNKISGQSDYSNQSWLIEVDITYRGLPPELAVLAVLLACNDIFEFHYS